MGNGDALRLDGVGDGALVVGERELPLYRLESVPVLPAAVHVHGASFRFRKSYPDRGWSAAVPADLSLLDGEHASLFVLRRGRLCLYVADSGRSRPGDESSGESERALQGGHTAGR